jgi:hypothetical protein
MSAWRSNNRRQLAGIFALGVAAISSGCGPDWWISEYPTGVSFHGAKSVSGGPYYKVVWKRGAGKGDERCPLKIELEGKVWEARELELENFLKSGALDNFKETDKALGIAPGKSPTKGLPPSCSYHGSGVLIICGYDQAKTLERVEVVLDRGSKGNVRITTPQGTVTLPTNEENLTRKLGEPTQFRSGRNRWTM